ncbi:tRNA (32-2'-O)-methyltransferase regulator THADA-like [Gastrophryne carolinensis]
MVNAGRCGRLYRDMQLPLVYAVALKLEQFAESSVKRYKEKCLDEAYHALQAAGPVLANLSDEDFLPLLCCALTCQMNSCNSSSLFLRLEKILANISQLRPCLVSQQRELFLRSLLEDEEVLQPEAMQAVCMYLDGSPEGQAYFTQNLPTLLLKLSLTVDKDQSSESTENAHVKVKLCLQLFRVLAKDISPLVWNSVSAQDSMESILKSLLHIIINKKFNRDARMLAGTAVASLANTGPNVESAAQAVVNLVQQFKNDPGMVQFGKLCVSLSGSAVDNMGLLAVLQGLLTCGHRDILSCVLHTSNENITLLEVLLPAIASLCEGQAEQYYSFQVLCLWLQRVHEQLSTILKFRGQPLMTNEDTSAIVTKLLWTGAEMQVDGMATLVRSCFQHLLRINRAECQCLVLSEEPMLQDILQKIMSIPWQARSRYSPLCALLPFLGAKKVLALYPLLPAHLFSCLATNYLCPPAAETYRTLISLQKEECLHEGLMDEEEQAEEWAQTWLSLFCDSLCSTDTNLQTNTATHLLPCTLHTFAKSPLLLMKELDGSGSYHLRGWISLVLTQKTALGEVTEVKLKLEQCLQSADDGVRLSALTFLCSGPKSNQPPMLEELQLLKEHLSYNMGCDSPGFRQQLQAALRRALERLRDAALSELRKGQSQKCVSHAIDFIEWLFQLSVSALSPAGNYQRRCSALLSLCSLLECCTDCWNPQKKKGQPPQDLSLLLNLAQQRGCWDFLSAHSMQTLLGCLQDSTNEIREMAFDLIARFFLPASHSLTTDLFKLGLKYLCSPRVPLAETGALIMKTLLQRPDEFVFLTEDVPLSPMGLVTYLIKMLKDHYCIAQDNFLQAASSKPLHGILSALRLCVLEVPSVSECLSQRDSITSWCSLLLDLVGLLQEITSFILSMLHKSDSAESTDVSAPSFEDMGNAVRALIADGKGLEEVQGDVLLSEEHSLIMTCCWVSLKETGMFLGPLVEKVIAASSQLPVSAVQSTMATYHDIFIRCRHWGAVDGCSAGLTKLCSVLLNHKDTKLRDLPRKMMEQVLPVMESQNSLSVTRRAAGFPVLLQCILSAEGLQHPMLEACVFSLLTLAQKPIPINWDQTRDLPQVTAVHALQSMLRCASLRSKLLKHAVAMMSLALVSLSSPCWAMRNAALQLFTALTVGMLELSRSDVDSTVQSTLQVGALFRKYPGLQNVLLQELQTATKKKMLHPSLHPILTLLARLQPGGDTEARCFIEPLWELRENPIYAVRVMAAHALVPVVQEEDFDKLLLQLTLDLPQEHNEVSHNKLHGQIQQIYALLSSAGKGKGISESGKQEVANNLLSALWLMSRVQKCPLVRHAFLNVLSLLSKHCGEDFARCVQEAVCKDLNAMESSKQVGAEAFHESCVRYLCNEASHPLGAKALRYVCQLLQQENTAVLKWLNEQQVGDISTELGKSLRDPLQVTLYNMLREDRFQNLGLYLESYVHLHRVCPLLTVYQSPCSKNAECMSILSSLLESRKGGPQMRGNILSTFSLLLVQSQRLDDLALGAHWLSALSDCADPAISCEKLRLAAANALQFAGADLVKLALEQGTCGLAQLAVRTLLLAVDLLQDEDRGVRDLTTRFAVLVFNYPSELTFHSDWAILRLLELLRDRFWNFEETFHGLTHRLPGCDLHAALLSLNGSSFALYEEDEPNMFADHNFLSSLLHPMLHDLIKVMSCTASLDLVLLQWVQSTTSSVNEALRKYCSWTEQHGSISCLEASGSPRVHSALIGLLVKGELLLQAHEGLTQNELYICPLELSQGHLRENLAQLRGEFALQGLGHISMTLRQKVDLFWSHRASLQDFRF